MKVSNYLYIIIIILLWSCSTKQNQGKTSLANIDIKENPTSALNQLDSIKQKNKRLNKEDRMYIDLLTIQAKDVCNQDITDAQTINSIQQIISFYNKNKTFANLKLAYYYAGRIYVEKHDSPKAIHYFQKAKSVPSENYQLDCKIASQIGYLFYEQRMTSKAKDMFQEAYKLAQKCNDTTSIILTAKDLASLSWDKKASKKQGLSLLHQTLKIATEYKDLKLINNIRAYIAGTYMQAGNYTLAKHFIAPVLKNIAKGDTSGVYSIAAEIYSYEHNDSANIYYQYLAKRGSIFAKENAYYYFTIKALENNNKTEAINYLALYHQAIDTVRAHTDADASAKVNALYNYQQKEIEKEKLKIEKTNNKLIASIIIGILSCIIIAMTYQILYIRTKSKEKNRQICQLKNIQKDIQKKSAAQIQKNIKEIRELEQKILQINSNKMQLEDEIKHLKATTNLYIIESKQNENALNGFTKSSIFTTIKEKLKEKDCNLNKKEKAELENSFDSYFPILKEKLAEIYPNYKQHEILTCILTKVGFMNSDIGRLLSYSPSGITKMKERLYKKTFSKKGNAKDWDDFICAL